MNYGVKVYLDEDVNSLPPGINSTAFLNAINNILQTKDPNLHVHSVTGYGSFSLVGKNNVDTLYADPRFSLHYRRSRLNRANSVRETPGRSLEDNLSHLELKEDMISDSQTQRMALGLNKPENFNNLNLLNQLHPILVCTSDSKFVQVIEQLKQSGHKVFVMCHGGSTCGILPASGHFALNWPW